MESRDRRGSLRLVRMAAESVLNERVLAKDELDGETMAIIVRQVRRIVEEMRTEWEANPVSDELKEGFRLLLDYLGCLERHRAADADISGAMEG